MEPAAVAAEDVAVEEVAVEVALVELAAAAAWFCAHMGPAILG
jgi:hypothetical protein